MTKAGQSTSANNVHLFEGFADFLQVVTNVRRHSVEMIRHFFSAAANTVCVIVNYFGQRRLTRNDDGEN